MAKSGKKSTTTSPGRTTAPQSRTPRANTRAQTSQDASRANTRTQTSNDSGNTNGSVRYKVRLCACGYSQKYGIDYDETFAPTAKFKSVTTILSIAAMSQWQLTGIDVENAFVEAKLDRPILMNLPTEAYSNTDGSPLTVKLLKSLYGLKQAPELWDKFLVSVIKKLGFKQFMHDQCVFQLLNSNNERVIIIKYVDDIIITGNSSKLIQTVIDHFEKSFTLSLIHI